MKNTINKFFEFPETINEVSARFVALGVLTLSSISLFYINSQNNLSWLLITILMIGFLARVSSGPKWSFLAIFVTKLLVPNLPVKEKIVPGPPKRFAQGIGLVVSLLILFFWIINLPIISSIFLIILISFASLESFLGFCFGCKVFGYLMRTGLIPKEVCEKCSNYSY